MYHQQLIQDLVTNLVQVVSILNETASALCLY